jgi:hypothetical protein
VSLRSKVIVLLLAVCCTSVFAAQRPNPCAAHRTQSTWHIFVDNQNRFCFEYPPQYQVAPTRTAPGVGGIPANEWVVRLATKPQPMELSVADDEDNATINVIAYGAQFKRSGLSRFAPTGMEDTPPKRIHTARWEFYYYGPGGGGVDYPDLFYFDLRGRMFSFEFVGPYEGDKTPSSATKQIEPKLLASLREY